ncbi:MAG: DUF1559 domain-containing protein [Thermoguttaceae bacterium]
MRRHLFHNVGRGFTLVELLVVIMIIGILAGLLLPAVQHAREAARRTECSNHLGQLAKGALQHESANGFLPSGGWGWSNIGDPDRGYGPTQPGGWFYNLLPYIEQGSLHDLGVNIPYGSASGAQTQTRIDYGIKLVQTALPIANCPTRRRPALFPINWGGNTTSVATNYGGVSVPTSNPLVARTDYGICCGDGSATEIDGGAADPGFGNVTVPYTGLQISNPDPSNPGWYQQFTGVSFRCSQVAVAQIKGGTSNTILMGDKYDLSTAYYSGAIAAENENMYVGMDNDIFRTTYTPPLGDRSQTDSVNLFGSAHAEGCNFAFCDGSVRLLSYTIDPTTYGQLGRRVKTLPINDTLVH